MRPFLLLLTACVDLPPGWEDARPVTDLQQSDCEGSPYDSDVPETVIEAVADEAGVDLSVEPLHFRCAQPVAGFWRTTGTAVEVLLQPVDMNPSAVAGCDCLYRIEATVPAPEAEQVTVWRRWDNLNAPNPPEEVGEATIAR